jgi:ATP-dependent RNA helicase DDX47/RRP3
MDEADRLLNMDFGPDIDKIIKAIPKERNTYLFSATMTTKVAKLQKASLRNPVKIEISDTCSTVDTLKQYYLFVPAKFKDAYLIYILNELSNHGVIIFTDTCFEAQRLYFLLKNLGFSTIAIHGNMNQPKRLEALTKFKSKEKMILVATDVASRGLDIPQVDLVINFKLPTHSKDYIHRVGRTARAGRFGKSITFVTQ